MRLYIHWSGFVTFRTSDMLVLNIYKSLGFQASGYSCCEPPLDILTACKLMFLYFSGA